MVKKGPTFSAEFKNDARMSRARNSRRFRRICELRGKRHTRPSCWASQHHLMKPIGSSNRVNGEDFN